MSVLKGGNELFANIDDQLISSSKKVLLQNIEFRETQDEDDEAQKIYSKYKPINSAYSYKQLNTAQKDTVQGQRQTSNEREHVLPVPKIVFRETQDEDDEAQKIYSKYKPINSAYSYKQLNTAQKDTVQGQRQTSNEREHVLPVPKIVLYQPEQVVIEWKVPRRIGPGFANLGNTCFLNSVLQVLTYTAPLVNFVNSDAHRNNCFSVGFCMLCEFRNHITRIAKHQPQNGPIRPMTIIQKLSCISKNFRFGRQEDAHEFLRYLIEALRKSCLVGKSNLDRLSKETTAINQIFGGFFRSQVTCLACKTASNTYDPMMELNLDIKEANTIIGAMKKTIRTEKLDGDNKYFCERCRKKTPALKKGNIYRAPKILTLQLKRFDFQRLYGGKISKEVQFPECLDLGPFMSNNGGKPVPYKLYAVLVHSGFSCNSGHYYCYVKAPNGTWYEMNDSRVSQVGLSTVLRAQAYLLFYSIAENKITKINNPKTPDQKKEQYSHPKQNGSEQKQRTPTVKDIGISIARIEPRIVPIGNNREKINFSLSSSGKKQQDNGLKEKVLNRQKSSIQVKKEESSPKATTIAMNESSLEKLRKEYDSSDSEASEGSSKKEKTAKKTVQNDTNVKDETGKKDEMKSKLVKHPVKASDTTPEHLDEGGSAQPMEENAIKKEISKGEKQEIENTANAKTTPIVNTKSVSEDSLLSPPKSSNTDVVHQKRKIKTHVGTPQSNGKFGRWLPVKSIPHTFTPRAVLHRSVSDSVVVDKNKKTPSNREMHRQVSHQVPGNLPNGETEKTTNWVIQMKQTQGVNIGPMTPPVNLPEFRNNTRERTDSVTSETGSISTKTGEWDVYEKDLPDTPAPPYIPERHFAGWSVENSHLKDEKKEDASNDRSKDAKESNGKTARRLFKKEEKHRRRSERREGEKYRSREEDSSDENAHKHKKKSKKRKHSEKKEFSDNEEIESSPRKKRRSEQDDYEETKQKKNKKSKKKKHRRSGVIEKEEELESQKKTKHTEACESKSRKVDDKLKSKDKNSCRLEQGSRSSSKERCPDLGKVDRSAKDPESEAEEHKKKHKKSKKSKKRDKADVDESHWQGKCASKTMNGNEEESRYAAVKPPRRVSLTCLGGISTPKSETTDVYSKHSATAGKEMQERSSKKKRKKDKKHRVSDIDTRESLDENRSSREAPSKDESSLKSSTKDQSFRESPVRSFMKSAAPSRESSSSREKMSTNDRTSKDAPAKKWDEAPNKATSWNGSSNTAVLDSLLSKKSRVETWDNQSSETMSFEIGGKTKRSRDHWDEEYDEGKVKKVKKHHGHPSSKKSSRGNQFQKLQDRRNNEKVNDR